ncbi:hypothetical protein AtEden1_Chr1g0071691 [Arabidopsis thaliana]
MISFKSVGTKRLFGSTVHFLLLQLNVFAFNWIVHSSYLFHVHFFDSSFINHLQRFVRSMNGLCVRVYYVPTLRFAHRVVGWIVLVYAKAVYMHGPI